MLKAIERPCRHPEFLALEAQCSRSLRSEMSNHSQEHVRDIPRSGLRTCADRSLSSLFDGLRALHDFVAKA